MAQNAMSPMPQATPWDNSGDLDQPYTGPMAAPSYAYDMGKVGLLAQNKGMQIGDLLKNAQASIASGKHTLPEVKAQLDKHVSDIQNPSKMPDDINTPPPGPNPLAPQPQQAQPPPGLLDNASQDWLKPLVAYSDMLNGTNAMKNYQGPQTKADWLKGQNQMSAAQNELLGRDANSAVSKNARAATIAQIKSSLPNADDDQIKAMVPDTMSANDIENNSNLQKVLTGGFGVQGNQAKADAMQGRVGVMQGNQALTAGKSIADDSMMKQYSQISDKLVKGQGYLNSGKTTTNQLGEVAQDYSAALNNGGISSDFKLKNISTEGLQDHINKALAWATNNPDQPAPAEEIKYWKDFGQRLSDANQRQAANRTKILQSTMLPAVAKNQAAINSINAAATPYINGSWNGQGVAPPIQSPITPDVAKYAATHGITPEQALQIKNKRTGGQ